MSERKSLLFRLRNDGVNIDDALVISVRTLDRECSLLNDAYLDSGYSIMASTFREAYRSLVLNHGNTIDNLLDFSDLVLTVFHYYSGSMAKSCINQVKRILLNALNQSGYDVRYNSNDYSYECYRKDIKAEMAAANQSTSTKDKIYNYLSLRDGMINEKRELLKSLIDDVEVFCKKKSSIKEIDKTKQFYQCVRHTKDSPKKEFPFYYENEEKWLDNIFQMVIDVLSFKDLCDRVKTVIDEENKNGKQ